MLWLGEIRLIVSECTMASLAAASPERPRVLTLSPGARRRGTLPASVSHLDQIRSYDDALNTGDAKRLDRGTEWFRLRNGRIAEVRAYHHGGPKNPQGALLGFDHAGRGHTTLEDWRAP